MQLNRRFFPFALVGLLYMMTAAAAFAQQPFTCLANSGTPTVVRVEGITELVGDLLLQCYGGTPTPAGQPVPVTNVRVTLNTNITSRLIGSGFSEALALIDEPYPNGSATPQNTHPGPSDANNQANGGTVGNVTVLANSPYQTLCENSSMNTPTPGACNYVVGTYTSSNSTSRGSSSSPYVVPNAAVYTSATKTASTVYEAQVVGANAVEWEGLPIDPPGVGYRTIRLTNIRANASMIGLSSTQIPTQVVAFVSITGASNLTINNPQLSVAFLKQGLVASATPNNLPQSQSLNTTGSIVPVSQVVITEGFAQSFKPQHFSPDNRISGIGGVGSPGAPLGALLSFYNFAPQNVPGYSYNTESGLEPTATNGSTLLNGSIGTANFGTDILLRFANVGSGANVILPGVVALTQAGNTSQPGSPNPSSSVGGWTGGYVVLVGSSDINGNVAAPTNVITGSNSFVCGGPFFSTCPFNGPGAVAPFTTAYALSPVSGFVAAVYEVVNADPSVTESASIPVGVSFVSGSNLPATGEATVSVSFARLSTDSSASATDHLPRFADYSAPFDAFNIVGLLSITKTHTGNFTQGQQNAKYQVTVSNDGSTATSGMVTVTESVPAGLTLVSMSGSGWTCPGTAANNCTRFDPLNAGASYQPITVTVNVASNATSPQVNSVSVTGGGSASAMATDVTNIIGIPPVLSISKRHTGNFVAGQQNATYQITVSNAAGAGPTSGQVGVNDMLPSGLTPVSIAGDGWTCVQAPVNTCTRTDTLNPGSSYPPITVTVNVNANATSPQINTASVGGGGFFSAVTTDGTFIVPAVPQGLGFFPLTPCRMVDTRASQNKTGAFGAPMLQAYSSRDFPLQSSSCGLPQSAQAYSTNITVVPDGTLDFLSLWPTSQPYPGVSTLNSPDGSVLANAALLPAGDNWDVTAVSGKPTDLIMDVNGYFAPPNGQELAFYPVTPCRVVDTRAGQGKSGAYGPPNLGGNATRDFPIAPACGVPTTAKAYSLNMTAVPLGDLNFLSMWPAGQGYPGVSTLNSPDGSVIANAAIVPAGTNGAITVLASDPTHLIIDVNGYFGPPGLPGALHFYPMTPCRVVDTRSDQGKTGKFGPPSLDAYSNRDIPMLSSSCNIPGTAQAYALNMTALPQGHLDFLSTWPTGQGYPGVSTLNSPKGTVIANAAIVPAGTSGSITVVAGNPTDLIIDINGYFAP